MSPLEWGFYSFTKEFFPYEFGWRPLTKRISANYFTVLLRTKVWSRGSHLLAWAYSVTYIHNTLFSVLLGHSLSGNWFSYFLFKYKQVANTSVDHFVYSFSFHFLPRGGGLCAHSTQRRAPGLGKSMLLNSGDFDFH